MSIINLHNLECKQSSVVSDEEISRITGGQENVVELFRTLLPLSGTGPSGVQGVIVEGVQNLLGGSPNEPAFDIASEIAAPSLEGALSDAITTLP